jgi:ribosome-binding factor A
MSVRTERVRELLKRELGEILRRELAVEEVGLVTVNEVTVTSDLQSANVYYSILGNPAQKQRGPEVLEQRRKEFQNLLGHSVVLKYTPILKFVQDDSIVRGNRVLRLIEEIEKSSDSGETTPKDH